MRLLLMVVLLLQYSDCWSESWVQVTSTTQLPGSSLYDFSYDYSWPYESSNAVVSVCQTGCIIHPFYVGGQLYTPQGLVIKASDNCYNMKCIRDKWVAKFSVGGTSHLSTSQEGARTSCWSYVAFPFSGEYPTGSAISLPGASCGIAPPPGVECNISLQDIDHGVLKPSAINGSTKSETGQLICNAGVTAKLTLGSGDSVHLYSNGVNIIDSEVYINDVKVGGDKSVTITAINGITPIIIKSVLHSVSSPMGGEFSGSSVILMSLY
ncbi:hypothetical protein G5643_15085 [Serratia marcescens]|uniref:MrpH family fimbial adhesin n=1 Tax=Serratia marcescens TaxID=615 RepID=UPI0013D9E3BA|nr:hypothetical protein [Serratia marcescens]NGH10026.1 hypothetical protein [Serratia marcescens]